jgi:RNA polymerase sigma factor (sigma-70 family)
MIDRSTDHGGSSIVPLNRMRAVSRGFQTLFHAGSLTGATDGQLLERFAVRDGEASEAAFAALVERHGPLVWRACRAMLRDEHEAADAFQATFLVLVRKAGTLWVRDSLAPWLYRVALRAANQARREAKRRRQIERRVGELRAGWTGGAMTDDLIEVLHREIDRLPERHRNVIVLCDLEGRSYEEAARHLRCPVGTVRSRLARAREKLREALSRRGLAPAAVQVATSREAPAVIESPPRALAASTIRGSVLFVGDPIKAAGAVSRTSVVLAEGVLRTMFRAKLQGALLVGLAVLGVMIPAWVAFARQVAVGSPRAEAVAAPRKDGDRAAALEGNWIVRSYPGGAAFALIEIKGLNHQARAHLRSISSPDVFDLAGSKVDHLRIDEDVVRFTLELKTRQPDGRLSYDIVAYRSSEKGDPRALWGSLMETSRGERVFVYPTKLEHTDRTAIDVKEAAAPSREVGDLQVARGIKDPGEQAEYLEGMLERYKDNPVVPLVAWSLAIKRANSRAPEKAVRAAIDRAFRSAAPYGRQMEIGTINVIVNNLVGAQQWEHLVLEYARKSAAMLHPDDPPALQIATLKNLASALRKSSKIAEAGAIAEVKALDDRIAALGRRTSDNPSSADRVLAAGRGDDIPWARSFAAARQQARAAGKPIMVDFYTQSCRWCKRLDAEVFPRPAVGEAMRAFVPVKVDAEDGEGRPLAERYRAHIQGYPAILFLDPTSDDPKDSRIVAKIPGFMPASSFAEQLRTIARLPKDVDQLVAKVHPDDGDAMRLLATALTMQGRVKEAVALIDRARGPGSDPDFDRWAAVYSTLGDEVMLHRKLAEAADWYNKAARVAKRPIDVYNAHLGVGLVASLQREGDLAAWELEAAARVVGVSGGERDFAKELLGMLAKPLDGSPGVPKAAAALKRLE